MRWVAGVALLAALAGCSAAGPPARSAPSAASSPPAPATAAAPVPVSTPEPTVAIPPPPTPTRDPLADLAEGIDLDEGPVLGADISWPQCPPGMGIPEKRSSGQPMPVAAARYVVVGLTNGPGFHPNPCLAAQVSWVRERGLRASAYAVASFPSAAELAAYGQDGPYDGSTRQGALGNVGYQQALFNVRSMKEAGLPSPFVWIDVEPVPEFEWSGDASANAAVVAGAALGYEKAGLRVGVYSTPLLWRGVVGDLTLGGVPEWRAAGQTSQAEALRRCGTDWSIQGGRAVLGQWVQDARDMNVTCPGASADLASYFHRF